MAPNTPGRGASDADPTPSQVNAANKVDGGSVDVQLATLRAQVEAAHYEVRCICGLAVVGCRIDVDIWRLNHTEEGE